jgi:hypothetical protein
VRNVSDTPPNRVFLRGFPATHFPDFGLCNVEPARLKDAPLALVEHGERTGQRLAAVIRAELRQLKEALAETLLENRLLKKSVIADGGDDE